MVLPLPVVVEVEGSVDAVVEGVVDGSVDGVVLVAGAVAVVSGVVVDGVVVVVLLLVLEVSVPAVSRWPQAVRDRAASRARAAHCALGETIIGSTP
jgi:hypothetical protein